MDRGASAAPCSEWIQAVGGVGTRLHDAVVEVICMKTNAKLGLVRFWAVLLLLVGLAVPLPDAAQLAPAPTAADSKTTEPLPPAQDILARFVKVIGGEAAYAKINSQHLTGKCDMGAQGITGDLEVFAKRPDKLLIKIKLPGVGDLLQGFDGKVGWSVNPITGPMVLDGRMLEQLREQAQFDAVLHKAGEFKSMETLEKTEFEGKDCYKVKLVRKSGQETIEYYEVDTGLLAGSSEVQQTPLGAISVTGVVSDYKRFGEILFATRLTQKMGPLAEVMSFDKMEINNVDDSVFDLPAQIKALVKK